MTNPVKPEDVQDYGRKLQGIPDAEPMLAPPATLGADGPLSAGLSTAQTAKQFAAMDFVTAKDDGIRAAGQALVRIGSDVAGFDRKGAAGIQQVLPAGG
jgi:hypothetical protein